MKKFAAIIWFVLGMTALSLLLPLFDAPLPRGLKITRSEARAIADSEARKLGIPIEKSWAITFWEDNNMIEKELDQNTPLRRKADADPVVGPRLGDYRTVYFRVGLEKFPEFGYVRVAGSGQVIGARLRARAEELGSSPAQEQLRPVADRFIATHPLPGAPAPQFETARPTVMRGRTDYLFRYRVPSTFPAGRVAFYAGVYFVGDRFAGWDLVEEYSDGSQYRGEFGQGVAGVFLRFAALFAVLIWLLVIFLKKYHAGEVGVGISALLFIEMMLIAFAITACTYAETSYGVGLGGIDARATAFANAGFKTFFVDIPLAVLVFFAWAVGESYARERWGEKLAAFDAIFRRDPINATVGHSLIDGVLLAPAVAAASLILPAIAIRTKLVTAIIPDDLVGVLISKGGAFTALLGAWYNAIVIPIAAVLFALAFFRNRRLLPVGIIVATLLGAIGGACSPPIQPVAWQMALGIGAPLACVVIFLRRDLLTTSVALFGATLLTALGPFVRVAAPSATTGAIVVLTSPLLLLLAWGIAGISTKREVGYAYEDLAPHVKRIIERERVKAEIDAANRIQAALLPSSDPQVHGISVSSYYGAATEIGGDYFDFLPLEDGSVGVAFGDVAGHGLTSGILMAMAKAALLVQIGHDSTPHRVMEVLNQTVLKTAPKRMMMTFFFGILDPIGRKLRFSSAGHLDPYVFRARDGRLEPLSSWGFPLGVRRKHAFEDLTFTFSEGDRLVLYSDGLIEALDDDGEPFGFNRFEQVIVDNGKSSAEEMKKALLQSIRKFTKNRPPEDDQTLVVISFDKVTVQPFRKRDEEVAIA